MDLEDGRNGRAGGKNFLKRDKKRFFSKKDEKKEKRPTVSTFAMFRYSNWLDRLYMVLGTLAAIIHGAGLPLMMLVFGDMTDSFAAVGSSGNITFPNTINGTPSRGPARRCCTAFGLAPFFHTSQQKEMFKAFCVHWFPCML